MADTQAASSINNGFVDTKLGSAIAGSKAALAGSGTAVKSGIDELTKNTAALDKFTRAKVMASKTLKDAAGSEAKSVAVLAELDQMRLNLMQAQGRVAKQNNKELLEHYNKQLNLVKERIGYVKQTHALDRKQLELFKEADRLQAKQDHSKKKLSADEATKLKRDRAEIKHNNELLALRTNVEQKSVQNHKSIAEAEKSVLDTAAKKRLYKSTGKIEVDDDDDDASSGKRRRSGRGSGGHGSDDSDNGERRAGMLSKLVGGTADVLMAVEGMSMVKSGLMGVMHASDLASESQYQYGISLDRVDHSMFGYASRTAKTVEMNTLVGISFARMGLSADEAQEALVKLITGSGMAMRAYQSGDVKKVEKMAETAAAFSRQTGMAFEDVVGFQNTLIANFGETAEQATSDMNDVVGAIQGMNNKLMDAGFKGALLNMGEYSNLIKETAENTEDLALNTSDYAKRMLKAAANVRLMGATEKEASRFAAAKSKFYEGKNPFVDMQVGQKMIESLQRDYGNEIRSGNTDAIAQDLSQRKGLSKNQALLVASMLTSKKPIPMLGNQLAEILRGTSISNETKDRVLEDWFKKTGITRIEDVAQAANDQVLMKELGLEWEDPKDRLVAVDYAEEFLINHGYAQADPELAKRMEDLKKDDAQYQKEASGQAASGQLEKNSPLSGEKATSYFEAFKNSPLAIPTGLAITAYGGEKAYKLGKWLKNRQSKMDMSKEEKLELKKLAATNAKRAETRAFNEANKAAGGTLTRDAWKSGATTAATTGVEDIAKIGAEDVAKVGLKDVLKSGGKSILKGVMKNKIMGLVGGGLLLSTLFGKSANAADIGTTNSGIAPSPGYGGLENNAEDLAGNLVGNTAMHFGAKGLSKLGTKLGIGGAEKLATSGAVKLGAGAGANAIPFLGGIISAGMTYAMTKGPIGRKLSAAAGDFIGDEAGSFAGPLGGIAGGAGGQFAGTELYDWLNGEDGKGRFNAAGSVAGSGSMTDSTSTSTGTSGTATTQGSGQGSRITNVAVGRFGTVRSDGSVDIELTARVQNFVPAVSQASTQAFANQTQFSGSKKS